LPYTSAAEFRGNAPPQQPPSGSRSEPVSEPCKNALNPQGSPETPRRAGILVSFGAEDAAGLTIPSALALLPGSRGGGEAAATVSALFGPLNKTPRRDRESLEQAGVRVLDPLPNPGEKFADYGLVVTHFGVTAFEALHAGAAVILVSPSRYHEQLARTAGFISAGTGPAACRKLRALVYGRRVVKLGGLHSLRNIELRCRELAVHYLEGGGDLSLGGLIGGFTPLLPSGCPVCGRAVRLEDPVLARFPERTYRRCRRCSLVYLERAAPPPVEYGIGYFFDSYKKQYGKTYLEDFPGLKKAGESRLRRIRQILAGSGGPRAAPERLLDIGCAFGPFLAAAAEAGFDPLGIDPSEEATAYVRDTLRIPVRRGIFPDAAPGENGLEPGFAVITLWYVIEHFRAPGEALAAIHRLLRPGGVLAFSTPSFSGISGRKSPPGFLRASPADHWTVWDPRRVRRILNSAGFTVKKTVITGHHPERFPVIGRLLEGRREPVYRVLMALSRILGWGDTFEVYAVKRDIK
jgi:2-polyprenyl-3-methyl-5-hydroxy-6-metoxy-1,4-benzoquinol methylase